METFKLIQGYNGKYAVSNTGTVISYVGDRKILKHHISVSGYHLVTLYEGKKIGKRKLVHRLVAHEFIENTFNKRTVNHKDGDKSNNSVDNLEWATHQENNIHARATGLNKTTSTNNFISNNPNKGRTGAKHYSSKRIVQKDVMGNVIAVWESMMDVEREKGYKCYNISNCCRGKVKQSMGFIWEFI